MSDYLVRTVTKDGAVRGLACVTTELVAEACLSHDTWPTATAALGRALTGGALFGALLKTGQRVALKFEGNGPLRKIIVEAESNGAVRGYVAEPRVHLVTEEGRPDVATALGRAGFLTVTKDLGLKEPYRGMVQLHDSEIGTDLAWYLTTSEQIPSAVGLGVYLEGDDRISAAGGFLIQALPHHEAAAIDGIMDQIDRLPSLSELLRGGATPEDILGRLFAGVPYDTLEKRLLAYVCSCSRERIERVLLSLGPAELEDLIARQGETDVTCEFCRKQYHFSRHELEALATEIGPS